MVDIPPHRTVRTFRPLPALLALAVVLVAVGYLVFGRPSVRVKPASGSGQAMALAADKPADATTANAQ